VDIDEALAYGLERDIHTKKVQDENLKLFLSAGPNVNIRHLDKYYMSNLKSTNNLRTLTWAGDVCLDGKIRPRKTLFIISYYSFLPFSYLFFFSMFYFV